ncbi:MAG: helix-turn-helix domain-containing protein [Candidatus Solibacter sp.]
MAESGQSMSAVVLGNLDTLGIIFKSEWDTLTFLHRHSTSLGTAADIARLIGYDKTEIGVALHRLEALGLIKRSRVAQGIRIYECVDPPEPSPAACLKELRALAQTRTGRLVLLGHLQATRRGEPRRNGSGLHLQ